MVREGKGKGRAFWALSQRAFVSLLLKGNKFTGDWFQVKSMDAKTNQLEFEYPLCYCWLYKFGYIT